MAGRALAPRQAVSVLVVRESLDRSTTRQLLAISHV
jgi:hypothetical protein